MEKLEVPKALEEVWEWKEKAWEETKDMDFSELKSRLDDTMKKTVKAIGADIVINKDDSCKFVK